MPSLSLPQHSRLGWRCLAWSCVALGAAGTLLPLLPTTPFVLLAAWAAPKGSPRLAAWLQEHRHFGPMLEAWRQHRAIPRRAKWLAVIMLIASWGLLWWLQTAATVLVVLALLFTLVAGYLLSRPSMPGEN